MSTSRPYQIALAVVLASLIAGCGVDDPLAFGRGSSQISNTTVPMATLEITDFAFGQIGPLASGTLITVDNLDGVGHTFTAVDGSFEIPFIEGKTQQMIALATPGTFEFFCNIHPFMTGTITITPAG